MGGCSGGGRVHWEDKAGKYGIQDIQLSYMPDVCSHIGL